VALGKVDKHLIGVIGRGCQNDSVGVLDPPQTLDLICQ
jgi:hypothetical protein